jgi:hypothetical protein
MNAFRTIDFDLRQTTAGTAETGYACIPSGGETTFVVVGAVFVPDAARTASDTDFANFALKVGSTTIAEFTTETSGSGGTGNLVAGTKVDLTLSNAASNPLTAGTTILSAAVTKSGSGVALTGKVSVLLMARR